MICTIRKSLKHLKMMGSGMRNLTVEGKRGIWKRLVISILDYLAPLIKIAKCIIQESEKIQKLFIWGKYIPKKYETLRMDYKNGGLNNSDIHLKYVSRTCSSV